MKTKITAILALLAASVFAFAEGATSTEPAAPAPQEKTARAQKPGRPQISPEMREAFVQRMLLSLSEEDLAKLAERVAAIQKMSPEEKAEAVKALPKPQFRPQPQGKQGKPDKAGRPDRSRGDRGCAPQFRKHGPRHHMKAPNCGCPMMRQPRGPQGGCPFPPPPPLPAQDVPAAEEAPEAPAAE